MTLKASESTQASKSVQKVLHLMHQWQDDPSNNDVEVWSKLKKELNKDRLSKRDLFL